MNRHENPRVLITYTTSNQEPFRSLERKGALETWTKHFPPSCQIVSLQAKNSKGFSVLHSYSIIFERLRWGRFGRLATISARIFGKPLSFYRPKSNLKDSSLVLNIPEGLSFLGFKLLGAIDLMIEKDFDFLIYTNLSSYINTFRVTEILSSVDQTKDYYAGKRLPSDINPGISGSFIVLSRETCEKIKKNRSKWNHAYLDDIALLKVMKKIKVAPTFLNSLDILGGDEIKLMSRVALWKYPHFKCGPQLSGSKRTDFLVMRHLDETLFPIFKNS